MSIERYTCEPKVKGQTKWLIIIILLAILYSSGFSYINWNSLYGVWISNIISILFAIFLVLQWREFSSCNYKTEILLLMILPFISSVNTNALYGQTYIDSVRALLVNFVWVFYFVLHKYNVRESTILKAFILISIFIAIVQIIQQFTFPRALFGVFSTDQMIEYGREEIAEQRNGLWRFRISGSAFFIAPVLFACFEWISKRTNFNLIVMIALMLVSVYLTLTRQVIAACIFTLFVSFFIGKKSKSSLRLLLLCAVLLTLIYSYSNILFESFAVQTNDDMNEDNIRVLAGTYFANESISSLPVFLFGHGAVGRSGTYANLIEQLKTFMHFYTSDVGFIGMTYTYGAIYVFICYKLLWKTFYTYRKEVPLYIRMFVIFTGVMSIMIFPMTNQTTYLIWAMLIHISDLYINRSNRVKTKEYKI